ncbi:MAG: exosortase C-terminal domain/associated protein EpsI, partial [Endomicrobiales bacterium]
MRAQERLRKITLDLFPARCALLAGALACFGAAGLFFESRGPRAAGAGGVFGIPFIIGEWRGREIYFRDEVRGILETDSVLMREYRRAGRRVRLAIVYYADARVALHLPESCYTGQGSRIVEKGREKLG